MTLATSIRKAIITSMREAAAASRAKAKRSETNAATVATCKESLRVARAKKVTP
jgi:hypothetical protein